MHTHDWGIVVPLANDVVYGSYAMIDPLGMFFQSTPQAYFRSAHSNFGVGVVEVSREVLLDGEEYDRRGSVIRAFPPRSIAGGRPTRARTSGSFAGGLRSGSARRDVPNDHESEAG